MNKREAKRLAEEDTTVYAVYWRSGAGLGLATCTGYCNASIFRRGCGAGALILTGSEIERVRGGWRP